MLRLFFIIFVVLLAGCAPSNLDIQQKIISISNNLAKKELIVSKWEIDEKRTLEQIKNGSMTSSKLQSDIDAVKALIEADLNLLNALKPYANEDQLNLIERQQHNETILKARLYLHELFINRNIDSADVYRSSRE